MMYASVIRPSTRNCCPRWPVDSLTTSTISRSSYGTSARHAPYQLSTKTNETNERDDRNFSHASLRRIRAEVMLDTISQIHADQEQVSWSAAGISSRRDCRWQHDNLLLDCLWTRFACHGLRRAK